MLFMGQGSREPPANANPLVRAISNMPCYVGEGMTAVTPASRATSQPLARAQRLFAAAGKCIAIEERQLNAVTATRRACGVLLQLERANP